MLPIRLAISLVANTAQVEAGHRFGIEFSLIATTLETTPAAARKLASQACSKIAVRTQGDELADNAVVDAFMSAARDGDLTRLLALLAPGAW